MALTDFSALDTQQKKVWQALAFQAGRDQSFFMGTKGFMGSSSRDATKPIHFVSELTETERGAKCVMALIQDLQGDGVTGDNELEGNEEALAIDDLEIQVDQLRNGVKRRGRMSEQKTVHRFRVQAKDKLSYWFGNITDEILFLVASGVAFTSELDGSSRSLTSELPNLSFAADVAAPSSNRKVFAGTATTTGTLTANDKMSWNLLSKAKASAIRRRVKPVRINGTDTYIVVMSCEQARDLQADNDYRQIVANAGNRGKDNELFTGAFARVQGLILYEHVKVYSTLGLASASKWGSGGLVDGAQALLLGAQALGFAKIGSSTWDESDNTDYGNRVGISYGGMIGAIKTKFKSIFDANTSQDFSLISIYTAAAAS